MSIYEDMRLAAGLPPSPADPGAGLAAIEGKTLDAVRNAKLTTATRLEMIRPLLSAWDKEAADAKKRTATAPTIAPGTRGMSPVVSASHSSGRAFAGWPSHPIGMQKSFLDDKNRLVPSACRGKQLYCIDGETVSVDQFGGVSFSRPARPPVNVPGPEETLESMRRAIGLPARK
jgi:hypothetical protein